jgi:hypothetical protein
MASKVLYFPCSISGLIGTYSRVRQISTGYLLDNNDGVFRAICGDPNVPLTEDADTPYVYFLIENRIPWGDGEYNFFGYDATGLLFSAGTLYIYDNAEVLEESYVIEIDTNLKRALGLLHENIFIDQPTYDTNNNLVSARVRIYSNPFDVGTAISVIGTYTITAVGDGAGKFTTWQQVKV